MSNQDKLKKVFAAFVGIVFIIGMGYGLVDMFSTPFSQYIARAEVAIKEVANFALARVKKSSILQIALDKNLVKSRYLQPETSMQTCTWILVLHQLYKTCRMFLTFLLARHQKKGALPFRTSRTTLTTKIS